MRFWLTVTLLLFLIASAHRYGRGPERWVANLLGANLLLSILNLTIFGTPGFDTLNYYLAAIDGFTLVGLTWIAVRANRMWTLVIASLQMVVMFTHASVLLSIGWTRVYYGMIALSQYCELVTLAIGIAYHAVRERKYGLYREWRQPYRAPVPPLWPQQGIIAYSTERHTPAIHAASVW